jgi:hypothetical protein
VFTSNLGTQDISKAVGLGFAQGNDEASNYDRMKEKVNDELKRHFRPEFLNRIDDVVVFHQLTNDEILQMVDLMLTRVEGQLRNKDMALEVTPAAKELLPSAASTRCWVPGRCAGRSSGRSRTSCRRRSSSTSCDPARSSSWMCRRPMTARAAR